MGEVIEMGEVLINLTHSGIFNFNYNLILISGIVTFGATDMA